MNEYKLYRLKKTIEDIYENIFVENSDLFKDFFIQLEPPEFWGGITAGRQFSTYWNKIDKSKYGKKFKDKIFDTAYFTIEFTNILGKIANLENKPKTAIIEIAWYRPQAYLSNCTAQMLRDFQKRQDPMIPNIFKFYKVNDEWQIPKTFNDYIDFGKLLNL